MPISWMHVQWNTYGSWLPGDPRGFRNRDHRIHSSGTYKCPPPPGEHAGLRHYAMQQMKQEAVALPPTLRPRVLDAVLAKADQMLLPIEAIAVANHHVHCLMFVDTHAVDAQVTRLKRHSSHAIRDALPGTVWSAGCNPEHVEDQEHWINVVRYILDHEREGAPVWRRPAEERKLATERWRQERGY